MTVAQARKQLRSLAVEAARFEGGRLANRLSAYAVLVDERTVPQLKEMRVALEILAEPTLNGDLARVLHDACQILRALEWE